MAQTKDYNYYYKQGYELGYKQKWKESVAMFDSALQLQPKNPDAYIGRGGSKVYNDMAVEGLLDYDTAIMLADKKNKLGCYRMKEKLLLLPKMKEYFYFDQQLAIYNEAIAAFPDSPMAYLDRASFYFQKGRSTDAMADASKSMKICHTVAGYEYLACYMKVSRDYSEKKIVGLYNKCVEEFPNDAESYFNRAGYFEREENDLFRKLAGKIETKEIIAYREKSIADYEKAVEINPNEAKYYQNLINVKMESKENSSKEIMNDFQKWKEHCPDDKFVYFFRANYYASIKRWNEAVIEIDSAIIYDKSPFFITLRADYKDRSGNYKPEDILKDLDKAAALKVETGYGYDEEVYKRLRARYGK